MVSRKMLLINYYILWGHFFWRREGWENNFTNGYKLIHLNSINVCSSFYTFFSYCSLWIVMTCLASGRIKNIISTSTSHLKMTHERIGSWTESSGTPNMWVKSTVCCGNGKGIVYIKSKRRALGWSWCNVNKIKQMPFKWSWNCDNWSNFFYIECWLGW
jgi:hypothetical protein